MERVRDIRELTLQREEELRLLREEQTKQLEKALKDAHNEILTQRKNQQDLEKDFQYNLSLLEQRDEELRRYDISFTELRQSFQVLVAENSDLKIDIDRLKSESLALKDTLQSEKALYQRRIEEHMQQLETYRQAKDREVSSERAECARLQRELQAKLADVQGELGIERERTEAQFQSLMQRQENDLKGRIADLTTSLVEKEGQLREARKELQIAKNNSECTLKSLNDKNGETAALDKDYRRKEHELLEQITNREIQIADLRAQLSSTESKAAIFQNEVIKKLADMDRKVREKEMALQAAKEALCNQELELEQVTIGLKMQLSETIEALNKEQQKFHSLLEEKQLQIDQCKDQQLSTIRDAEKREAELKKKIAKCKLQTEKLQQGMKQLQLQLKSRDEDVERLTHELTAAAEHRHQLEQARVQADLGWDKKLAEERKTCSRHEDAIAQISTSRDKAIANCVQLQSQLDHQNALCKEIQNERDTAIASLKAQRNEVSSSSEDLKELEQRNHELKAVIQQMRKEMEQHVKGTGAPFSAEYVGYLEREMAQLKAEKREIAEHLHELTTQKSPPPTSVPTSVPTPTPANSSSQLSDQRHREHLIALSDTIATLKKDNSALQLETLEFKRREEHLCAALKRYQEEVYCARASQVSPSKVHQKLLQATQVIIALVREKEVLLKEVQWLRSTEVGLRSTETGLRSTETGLRSTETGLRSTEVGLRSTETGLRSAETGLRSTEGGLRSTETGLRSTEVETHKTNTGASGDAVQLLKDTVIPKPSPSQPVVEKSSTIASIPCRDESCPSTSNPSHYPPCVSVPLPHPTSGAHPPQTSAVNVPPPTKQASKIPLPQTSAMNIPPPLQRSNNQLNESSDFDLQHENLEKLLEELESIDQPAPPSQTGSANLHPADRDLELQGTVIEPHIRPRAAKLSAQHHGRKAARNKPAKIRNYNDHRDR